MFSVCVCVCVMCLLSCCFCFADVHIVSLLCLFWVKYHYFHPEILLPFVGNFGNSQWSFMLLSTRALQNPPMRCTLPGNRDLLGQTPQGGLAPRPAAARARVTGAVLPKALPLGLSSPVGKWVA